MDDAAVRPNGVGGRGQPAQAGSGPELGSAIVRDGLIVGAPPRPWSPATVGRRLRELGKRMVRETVGVLPYFEYRLRLKRLPETVCIRWREEIEVRRARRRIGRLPHARVVTVIPTYKRPAELLVAIESALAQTVRDHLVVVVDDGAGLPVLPADPRLVAISLTRNIGVVGAVRNVGIRVSTSDYLAFLDDDNWWEPDHLERSLNQHGSEPRLTYTGLRRVDAEGNTVDILSVPFSRRHLHDDGFIDASTIVVPRARRVLFSRTPRRFSDFPREDWELAWRLSRRWPVQHVPDVTVCYVKHDRSHFTNWSAVGT